MKAYERPRVSQHAEWCGLQRFFDEHFRDRELHRVLDAGAGFKLPVDIPRSAHLIAIDLDSEALAKNENADERLVADVEHLRETGLRDLDVVICWWVLEHVRKPASAIAEMARVLIPGGILVVGVPYFWGFKAFATKLTPFWFHLHMARRVDALAGTPGYGPYPTHLHRDIAPRRLNQIAARNGLTRVYEHVYSLRPEQRLPPPARAVWLGAGNLLRLVTGGRYNPLMSEYIAIYERR
jgi:SAM-dependent methyltransferase